MSQHIAPLRQPGNTLGNDDDYAAFRPDGWKARPTVLQVLPALAGGGAERGAVDVAVALARAGWNPVVTSAGGPMVHALERVGVRHVALPMHAKNPMAWRRNIDALCDLALRERVDIIHARSRMPAWFAWRAARNLDLPFVTTLHGRYRDDSPLKRVYNSVMTRGDRVIAISHHAAAEIAARHPIGQDRLRVIPRGVDMELFDSDRVSAERMIALAERWRLPDGVPVIMLPARLSRSKGHMLLIDALARLGDLAFRCLLVGPERRGHRYGARIEAQIRARGLDSCVHVTGDCRDMPAAYKLSDVVVSASLEPEPFGRVPVEAQAMGRPVVATGHGGAAETVLDGETGWLVTPNDPQALADGLRRALALNPQQRRALAGRARRHVERHYSHIDMCRRTLAVYCEVLPDRIGATPEPFQEQ